MAIKWNDFKEFDLTKDRLEQRYELISLLGKGSFGKVFKVKDKRLDRECALKVLDINNLSSDEDEVSLVKKSFVKEAKAYAKFSHPNIAQIFDTNEEDAFPYFVMEYIDGQTLADIIREKGKLSLGEVLEISKGILNALGCIHSHGLIHRDLKPKNIIVKKVCRESVIIDFGIVKDSRSTTLISSRVKLLGTPLYMSPEQFLAPGNVTNASDLYSFGVVLYEMLTGTTPFIGKKDSLMSEHLHEDVPNISESNSDLPFGFEKIIYKAMAKKPSNRYQSAQELLDDLFKSVETQKKRAKSNEGRLLDPYKTIKKNENGKGQNVLPPSEKKRLFGDIITLKRFFTTLIFIFIISFAIYEIISHVDSGKVKFNSPNRNSTEKGEKKTPGKPPTGGGGNSPKGMNKNPVTTLSHGEEPKNPFESQEENAFHSLSEKINRFNNNSDINEFLQTYSLFKKKWPQSIYLRQLIKAIKNAEKRLPPEKYWSQPIVKNRQGYFERNFKIEFRQKQVQNFHLMIYIPGKNFWIDKYEISWRHFGPIKNVLLEDANKNLDYPVDTATYNQVVSYCSQSYCSDTKSGLRLPTEKEWNYTAAGGGPPYNRKYPWGDQPPFDKEKNICRANYFETPRGPNETTMPINSFEDYACPFGCVNMAGNVWEWVQGKIQKGGGCLSTDTEEEAHLKIESSSPYNELPSGFRCILMEDKND